MGDDVCKDSRAVVSDIMGFFANNTEVDFPKSYLSPPVLGGAALYGMAPLLGFPGAGGVVYVDGKPYEDAKKSWSSAEWREQYVHVV